MIRAPWMRQAIVLGIDRQSIINTVYGALAGNTKPLNNSIYYSTQAAYQPDFAKWNYSQAKALAILKKHCKGGPSAPERTQLRDLELFGLPGEVPLLVDGEQPTRTTQEAIVKAELKQIGIEIVDSARPANVIFGPNGPGGRLRPRRVRVGRRHRTRAASSHRGAAAVTVTTCTAATEGDQADEAGDVGARPDKRAALFQPADKLIAPTSRTIPLYQRPSSARVQVGDLLGMSNNPATSGPVWNIEEWHWKS